jgi:hypothetical protein
MQGMFGISEGTTECRLHEYVERLNPDKSKKDIPFGLQVCTDIFPASVITINLGGEEVTDLEMIDSLAEAIAEQWYKKTKHTNDWKKFRTQRRQNAENKKVALKQKPVATAVKPQPLFKVADAPRIPTIDHQRDWPDEKPIDKSIFYRVVDGKPCRRTPPPSELQRLRRRQRRGATHWPVNFQRRNHRRRFSQHGRRQLWPRRRDSARRRTGHAA